jgi:hypothetical protein
LSWRRSSFGGLSLFSFVVVVVLRRWSSFGGLRLSLVSSFGSWFGLRRFGGSGFSSGASFFCSGSADEIGMLKEVFSSESDIVATAAKSGFARSSRETHVDKLRDSSFVGNGRALRRLRGTSSSSRGTSEYSSESGGTSSQGGSERIEGATESSSSEQLT